MKPLKAIDYFRHNHWLTPLQERVSLRARQRMYATWLKTLPGEHLNILDVGTTPDHEKLDSNCFLRWLVEDKHSLSVISPEDLSNLKEIFPTITILPPMPFNTKDQSPKSWEVRERSYDWVFSSAVIEHAGSTQQQEFFLKECARAANAIFLTTPNRWHWLEFHSKIPLIHWLPKPLHRWLLKVLKLDFWAKEENLNLLSTLALSTTAQRALGDQFDITIKRIWTLGMPSNLVMIAKRK